MHKFQISQICGTAIAVMLTVGLSACGGGSSSSSSSGSPSNNPVPTVTSLSPTGATAGATAQTLTINGTNFLSSSTVTYNAVAHSATFVSASQLTISLSAADQATAGSYAVVVTNPSPGGGNSTAVNFMVTAATPISVSISPTIATLPTGAAQSFTATVSGSSNTAVTWSVNGAQGGNSTIGTVSTGGLFTAPSSVPNPNTVTVTATSVADTTKSASAIVTLTPSSTTQVQINSLSQNSVAPFGQLTITGTGFNSSANAAISVLLTSQTGNPPVAVPVFSPTSTTLQIIVPPLFNVALGTFGADTVDVQVIQWDGTYLYTSNVMTGLQVGTLPSVPAGVANGAITLAFLQAGLNVANTLQGDATTNSSLNTLAADITPYNADINPLISGVQYVMNNPGQNVALPTSNGVAVALDQNTLAFSDQMILGYVSEFSVVTNGARNAADLARRKPRSAAARTVPDGGQATSCPPTTGDPSTDQFICSMQQSAQTQAVVGGQAVQLGGKFLYGAYIGMLGGFAADALSALGSAPEAIQAFQVAWSAAGSYVAAFGTASPAPTPCDVIESAGAQVFDNAAMNGVGVLSPSLDAYNLYKDASAILTPTPVSPCTGPLTTASQANAPSGTTGVTGFQTTNGTTTTTTLAAPNAQQIEPSSSAIIPPPATFTLTATATGPGSGSVESFPYGVFCANTTCSASFVAGATVSLAATPATGDSLSGWSGACSGIGPCVVTMNSDQSVTATFSPGQTYSGNFLAPFNGTFPDPAGDSYSATASGSIILNVVQGSNGSISGSASVPTYVGIAVASCPITNCSTLPFSDTPVGTISGTTTSFGGTFVSADGNFTMTFTGSLNGSSVTGSATFSGVFVGTSNGSSITTTLSGSLPSITLAAQ